MNENDVMKAEIVWAVMNLVERLEEEERLVLESRHHFPGMAVLLADLRRARALLKAVQ